MLRSQLIERLLETHPHLRRSVVEAALDAIFDEITNRLAQGERVEIRGFGSFFSKVWKARMGRNPKTGEPIVVAPKRHIHFRASKMVLEQLNRPTTPTS